MMVCIANSPHIYGLCGRKAILNSNHAPSERTQELCESRGGRPGLPVPNSPYACGVCGRKATLNSNPHKFRAQEMSENRGGCPGLPVPNGTVSVDVKRH